MKKRNKIFALVLTAVLAVSVTACGKKKETDPFAAAQENMENVQSVEGTMFMEMDMEMSAYGETQTMEMDSQMDMVTFSDPVLMKMDMTMTMSMGELGSTTETMTIYAEQAENDTYTMYLFYGGSWMTQEVSVEEMAQYDAGGEMKTYLDGSYNYEAKGTEQLDSGNAYKYSGKITGDDLKEVLLETGALDQLTQLGMDLTQLESLSDDVADITIDLWIDEATLYPVKYEMDMTAAMDALMGNMMEAMGDQAEGLTMRIPKMTISMTCRNYNAAAEFEIPAEAKAN